MFSSICNPLSYMVSSLVGSVVFDLKRTPEPSKKRRTLRSVGGLKHVTWRHFAWLRWLNEAEAGPEILRTYSGPTRPCVAQFLPRTDYTWLI